MIVPDCTVKRNFLHMSLFSDSTGGMLRLGKGSLDLSAAPVLYGVALDGSVVKYEGSFTDIACLVRRLFSTPKCAAHSTAVIGVSCAACTCTAILSPHLIT
jgi:hypothetical protein